MGIADFDSTLVWISTFLGRQLQGRLVEYRRILRRVLLRTLENRIDLLASELSETEFLNAFFEAETLIKVWRAFQSRTTPRLAEKLKIIIKSVPFARDEGEKTQARDTLFELQLAAFLVEAGIAVEFENPTDLSADLEGSRLLIECKRLQVGNAMLRNLDLAERQLVRWLSRDTTGLARGIIALDASKIYHLTFTGRPLYQCSMVGTASLPSSFLVADSDLQLARLMHSRFAAFMSAYRGFWWRKFEPSVIGLLIFFAVPGVSRERTYGLFHCRSPFFDSLVGISANDVSLLQSLTMRLRGNTIS